MTVSVHPPGRFPAAAARVVVDSLRDAVRRRGACSLALAGGSTPRPVHERAAQARRAPWERVTIFFGDERGVPPGHPESNYRMARESLLDRLPVEPARVHRMEAEREDLDDAARRYAALLPDALDVLLLGIGEDGHTASLFPGSEAAAESSRKVVQTRAPVEPRRRLTVTPPVIRAARTRVVLARGASKAAAVQRALDEPGDPADCPARLAAGGHWVLDREAATLIDG